MPKVQDLFKRQDGSNLLDVKFPMTIEALPMSPAEKELASGKTVLVHNVVLVNAAGEKYTWELNPEQLQRIFYKKQKDGSVTWVAKEGEMVNVWYATPKGAGRNPYFAAEPIDGDAPVAPNVDVAEQVADVFPQGNPVPSTVTTKPKFAPSAPRMEKTQWDGTPRQSSFRQGLAGMLQALISNPNVNPYDPAQITQLKELADGLVAHVRKHSIVLEQEIKE